MVKQTNKQAPAGTLKITITVPAMMVATTAHTVPGPTSEALDLHFINDETRV